MRRANKIIMAIVIILLCFVLVTTNIVSGIFAKYVTTKAAKTTLGFEAFGVEVEITVHDDLIALVGEENVVWSGVGDTRSVTINNLQMIPGDTFAEALLFQVTGTPNVDTKLRFTCEVDDAYNTDFNLPASVTGLDATAYPNAILMPLAFTCKTGTSEDVCGAWHNRSANYVEETIIRNTAKKLGAEYPTSDQAYDVENDGPSTDAKKKYFDANRNFFFEDTFLTNDGEISGAITGFYMGFRFPLSGTRKVGTKNVTTDIASTWIAEQGKTLSFTYTISVEQIVPET